MKKKKKEIEIEVVCPDCGCFMMDSTWQQIEGEKVIFCQSKQCKRYNIKYKYPKIRLKKI